MAARLTKLYTAQDVARFCEVDLKTVHHWAERGKVAHHRTEGGHLRFRRNDVVRFLRAHDYPLPDTLTRERPLVALAPIPGIVPADLAKKLASRFATRRFESAVTAIAAVGTHAPDAIVIAPDDPSIGPRAFAALKSDPETAWLFLACVGAPLEGADLGVPDASHLAAELGRAMAVVRS